MRLDQIGERAAIERFTTRLIAGGAGPRLNSSGYDSDAAALDAPAGRLVLTTDLLTGPTHFPAQATPQDMGWMLGAVNLSDLAAAGAEPLGLLAALGLPPPTPVEVLEGIADGLAEVCRAAQCEVLGGDTKPDDTLTLAATAVGTTPRPLTRAGGRPGDLLVVTGPLGGAAAGLARLRAGAPRALGLRLLRPIPRIAEGIALRGARAMTDLSDGLTAGAAQLAAASSCRAVLDPAAVPVAPGATGTEALAGAGDYELLAAIPADLLERVGGLSVVGRLEAGSGVHTPEGRPLRTAGWEHFLDRKP